MRISLSLKIGLAFGVSSLLVAAFVGLTIQNSMDDSQQLRALENIESAQNFTRDLELQTANIWQFLTDAALTRNQDAITVDAQKAFTEAKHDLDLLSKQPVLPDQNKLLAPLESSLLDFWTAGTAMYGAYGRNKADGDQAMESFDAAGVKLLADFHALQDPLVKMRDGYLKDYEGNLLSDLYTFTIFGALAVLLMLGSWIVLSRLLTRPIKSASGALRTLADSQGDLTLRLLVTGKDETADLTRSVNDFLIKIQGILIAIDETVHKNNNLAGSLNHSSRESATAVTDLSGRVTALKSEIGSLDLDIASASAAVEEILANIGSLAKQISNQDTMVSRSGTSIQMMMASVTGVSEMANSKVASVGTLVDLTRKGGERVKKTNAVIAKVAQNANAMMDLIALINDISDRTNLLAMNASIEAAHAGVAGRGFAVVANEIRKLAFDTSANAQKIGLSLKETGEQIRQAEDDGLATQQAFLLLEQEMGQFADAMHDVSESMEALSEGGIEVLSATAELIQTSQVISNSSQEMNYGAKEVLTAIEHVKQVSSEALADVNEIDGLAAGLNRSALRVSAFGNQNRYNNSILTSELARFRLGTDPTARSTAVAIGIDWNDILSVGIATMDEEHKELFKRINALLVALLGPEGEANIPALVQSIVDYTIFHFEDEQELMRRSKYPRYEQHKTLHDAFLKEFLEIQSQLVSGEFSATLLIRIQEKVVNWLLEHIARVDHDYGEFIAANQD